MPRNLTRKIAILPPSVSRYQIECYRGIVENSGEVVENSCIFAFFFVSLHSQNKNEKIKHV